MMREDHVYTEECAIAFKGKNRSVIICRGSVSRCLSIFLLSLLRTNSMSRYEPRSHSPYPHPYPPRPPSSYTPSFSFSSYHGLAPPSRLRPLPTRFDSGVGISRQPSRSRHVLVHPQSSERKETPSRTSLFRLFVCRGARPRSS
jgi:hypothetical protein